MKTLEVCFLWHMHQPYYTDRVTGSASMPWVRLHATKAYYDMAFLLERFPTARATFNFTPSLLVQLQEVASGSVKDLFLEHAARPAADLTPAERAFVVRHFFAANWVTMVRPYPRYHDLLVRRGTQVKAQDLEALARQFTAQDLLDLQVWHNLAWFGYGAVTRHPQLAVLRLKGRGFTEEEKQQVLAIQRQIVSEIIPMYRRLADTGQVELTTSPFYHPILPLLIDTDFARRARPETLVPPRFQAPEDAEWHLRRAVALHTELFGRPPTGCWPSEGSVCPEMLPMLHRAGFRWTATDEGILARSLEGWNRHQALYQPYLVGDSPHEVAMLFRDRELSDAIGFVYSKNTPESAVEHLSHSLAEIGRRAPGSHPLVAIVLDGENPWEHYYDGGEQFLTGLYEMLAHGGCASGDWVRIRAVTVSQALERHPPVKRLDHLHSGSWINQDFKVWLGHPEDNRGWELLRDTRARLVELSGQLPPGQSREAWDELYAAEGSDWFWWYGDDFETDYKEEFDRLFRTHLKNVFARAGVCAPEFLSEPLVIPRERDRMRMPVSLLTPRIDGLVTDFFEWYGAGTIDPSPPLGAMWRAYRFFSYIGFGFSLEALFLRLDPEKALDDGNQAEAGQMNLEGEVHISVGSQEHKLAFSLTPPGPDHFVLYTAGTGQPFSPVRRYTSICHRKVIEFAVPFADLNLHAGQVFRMALVVMQGGLEVERYPRYYPVVLTVPDRDFEAVMWKV